MGNANAALPQPTSQQANQPSAPSTALPSYGALPTPSATGFTQNALQQGQENRQTALYNAMVNNPNIVNPFGTQTVTYQDGVPTVRQTLTPEAQGALSAQQRADLAMSGLGEQVAGNVQQSMAQPFRFTGPGFQTSIGGYPSLAKPEDLSLQQKLDVSGLAAMPVNAGTTGQQAIMSRLQPQLQQERARLENQLVNQGVVRGTEAYDLAMREQSQRENDLLMQAALQGLNLDFSARQQGLGEQQTLGSFANQAALSQQAARNAAQQQAYDQALQNAQFGNTASQAEFARQLALRNQPLDEYAAIRQASPITMPNFPQFQGTNAQAAPIFDAAKMQAEMELNAQNANTAATNVDKQNYTALLQTLAGSQFGQNALSSIGNRLAGLFGIKPAAGGLAGTVGGAGAAGSAGSGAAGAVGTAGGAGTAGGTGAALAGTANPLDVSGLMQGVGGGGVLTGATGGGLYGGLGAGTSTGAFGSGAFGSSGAGALNTSGLMSGIGTGGSTAATGGAAGVGSTAAGGAGGATGAAGASTFGPAGLNLATLGPIGGAIAAAMLLRKIGDVNRATGSGTTDPYGGLYSDMGYGAYNVPDYSDPNVQNTLSGIDPSSGIRWEYDRGKTTYYLPDGTTYVTEE